MNPFQGTTPPRLFVGWTGAAVALLFGVALFTAYSFRGPGDEGTGLILCAGALTLFAMSGVLAALGGTPLPRPQGVDVLVALIALWMGAGALWHPAAHIQWVAWLILGGFVTAYLAGRLLSAREGVWTLAVPLVAAIALGNAGWSADESLVGGRTTGALFLDQGNLAAFLNLVLFLVVAWYFALPGR